ncbi:MAG: BNR-4 repeat-containing protein, partial [Planctomycetota bacterium]
MTNEDKAFARHGSQKMIYDCRMGPQCIFHDGAFYAAWQANPESGRALPHIARRGPEGDWSQPVVLGDVERYDHHLAPVIWLDSGLHVHALYHCHIRRDGARHLLSEKPLDVTAWREGPRPAQSISYPRVLKHPSGRLVLYFRALGHMGYWTCRLSEDGGMSWRDPAGPLVDLDRDPQVPGDEFAASYHSAALGPDGRTLYAAFIYKEERQRTHPLYKVRVDGLDRMNLYCARLDLDSGQLS